MGPKKSCCRVCVVGLGHWGPNFVKSINQIDGASVVCAVEISQDRRAYVSEKLPGLQIYSDFDLAAREVQFDSVVVATPADTHCQVALQAIDAGKHVLVEKPLADSTADATRIFAVAQRQGVILMVGHVFLFNQAIRTVREIIGSGDLGNILYASAVRTNLGPVRSDVSAMWDLASHDVAIFNYIFRGLPNQVSCTNIGVLGLAQPDVSSGVLKYDNNITAFFFVSWVDPQKRREITIVGDKKMLVFDDMKPDRPIRVFNRGIRLEGHKNEYHDTFESFRALVRDGPIDELDISTGQPLLLECQHFVSCVLGNLPPTSDGKSGVEVVRILESLDESHHNGGKYVPICWK